MTEAQATPIQNTICHNDEAVLVPDLHKNGSQSCANLAPKSRKRMSLDFSDRNNDLQKVEQILEELNNKTFGQRITITDLLMHGLLKISAKDIEQMRQASLSAREKITISWQQYNEKSSSNLSLDEFICRQLKL